MARIGVFLSKEGKGLDPLNLQSIADRLVEEVQEISHVFIHEDLNTVEGLEAMSQEIKSKDVGYVVIGCGSIDKREENIRKTLNQAGINEYLLEVVNLKEMVASVHSEEPEKANEKAFQLLKTAVIKVEQSKPLDKSPMRVEQQVLVVGGGVAGMTASLRIADAGYSVVLVEKATALGGKVASLKNLWPKLEEADDLMRNLSISCHQHENIVIYDYSEVKSIDGVRGDFDVEVVRKPRFVQSQKIANFDKIQESLTTDFPNRYTNGRTKAKVLYQPYPGCVPPLFLIDPENINHPDVKKLITLVPDGTVNQNEKEKIVHEKAGAVIMAFGAGMMDLSGLTNLTAGNSEKIHNATSFENINLKKDQEISLLWVADAGSNDPKNGVAYASEVPLMTCVKQAIFAKKMSNGKAQTTIIYSDRRSRTKGYEEFIKTAEEKYQVQMIRGAVSNITSRSNGLSVSLHNLIQGQEQKLPVDQVILAPEVVAHDDAKHLSGIVDIGRDESGFLAETHPSLEPCATSNSGVFVCGDCASPGDIRAAVLTAESAVAKAMAVLAQKTSEPYRLKQKDDQLARFDAPAKEVAPESFQTNDEGGMNYTRLNNIFGKTESGASIPASPTRNIELAGWELSKSIAEIENIWTGSNQDNWEPKITGFASQYGGYPLLETLGREEVSYSPCFRFLRVRSTAHLDPLLVLKSFFNGADGVFIIGGPLGKGKFHNDNYLAKRRFKALEGVLDAGGIEPDRVKILFVDSHQIDEVADQLHKFHNAVSNLGPLGI